MSLLLYKKKIKWNRNQINVSAAMRVEYPRQLKVGQPIDVMRLLGVMSFSMTYELVVVYDASLTLILEILRLQTHKL